MMASPAEGAAETLQPTTGTAKGQDVAAGGRTLGILSLLITETQLKPAYFARRGIH